MGILIMKFTLLSFVHCWGTSVANPNNNLEVETWDSTGFLSHEAFEIAKTQFELNEHTKTLKDAHAELGLGSWSVHHMQPPNNNVELGLGSYPRDLWMIGN